MERDGCTYIDPKKQEKKSDFCFQEAFAEIIGSKEKIVTSGSVMQLVSLILIISLVVMISLVICDEPSKLACVTSMVWKRSNTKLRH